MATLRLMHSDFVTIAGADYRLFDVGGVVAIAGLVLTFIVSAVANTRALYRAEPLPARDPAPISLPQGAGRVHAK